MEKKEFNKGGIFSYNLSNKKRFFFYSLLVFALIIFLVLFYVIKLKDTNLFFVKPINAILSHISSNIVNVSLMGYFYTALFGGLFFIPIPLELLFIKFIKAENFSIFVILFYILGLVASYSINYFIGGRLTNLSKKIISIRKFYKIKGFINRYGAWTIFFFNVLPLPSQLLSMVLGVFNYNKIRFYLLFISGQVIKYSAIAIGYFYIF